MGGLFVQVVLTLPEPAAAAPDVPVRELVHELAQTEGVDHFLDAAAAALGAGRIGIEAGVVDLPLSDHHTAVTGLTAQWYT